MFILCNTAHKPTAERKILEIHTVHISIQLNLSNSKLKGPKKKKKNYPKFELGKLCSKLEWVKGPTKKLRIIHEFEL